jgi:D-alanine-D-alanine ligase-like ATP-grasp enzyme
MKSAPVYCPDCGPVRVSHAVERWNLRADAFFSHILKPLEFIWESIRPAVAFFKPGRIAPFVFGACAMLGFGTIVKTPDEKTTVRTRVIWEEAERRGIVMREFRPFGLPRNIYFATYQSDTRVFDGLPRPRLANEKAQAWMDDKGIILEKFNKAGIPVPRGRAVKTIKQADVVFHEIGGPVIIKPAIGSRSRHTYLHLTNLDELHKAFFKAKEISPYVVVEEELPGFVFRITLIGGQIAGVMRREPPHVIGDGTHTIQELVTEENKNPSRHGPIFHELEIDPAILVGKNLSLDSVPGKGAMVILHPKVSRTFGASMTEIEEIHSDNRKLFLAIATVLDDPVVGIDFIMDDVARSWREQKCGIIECNSLPFIDLHHFPLKGPARNVAGMVWDLVFPK